MIEANRQRQNNKKHSLRKLQTLTTSTTVKNQISKISNSNNNEQYVTTTAIVAASNSNKNKIWEKNNKNPYQLQQMKNVSLVQPPKTSI